MLFDRDFEVFKRVILLARLLALLVNHSLDYILFDGSVLISDCPDVAQSWRRRSVDIKGLLHGLNVLHFGLFLAD